MPTSNVRLAVCLEDHCKAIDLILRNGTVGEVYNIGGHNEMKNIDIVKLICEYLGKPESLIEHVQDRKGHDMRYAIDPTKIHNELGWLPETMFKDGIRMTIQWYLDNKEWCRLFLLHFFLCLHLYLRFQPHCYFLRHRLFH